ncbi:hypothetical protein F3Y22_tig00001311pilonHSYRG00001 [Hibiscus syriacus]|uniref:Uncharacterized protein n=1 Tax=Hibiscus syriacus TaxID=106335 RepID=A0A6A3D0V8_HIBSY|nr:hypothetical protein F3Y22_tig00001311pilonHSYRG00001 [Hibiscus syriacus]
MAVLSSDDDHVVSYNGYMEHKNDGDDGEAAAVPEELPVLQKEDHNGENQDIIGG